MYAHQPTQTAAASYPTAASMTETHVGFKEYFESRPARMENERAEHQNHENLSVLAFVAMLGEEASEGF